MGSTGYVYSDMYLKHDTGPTHPERAERLRVVNEALTENPRFDRLVRVRPYEADTGVIELCHDRDYIARVKRASESGLPFLDTPDCPVSPHTYEAALWAVGGVMASVDAVMAKEVDNCFAAVRPPGHHAERAKAMGFCFFNNVAIGARYVQKKYGLERVMVFDWDVHHGNGTQHIFEYDPTVYYISLHEDPTFCYPGTGRAMDMGRGPGEGYTLNIPMPPDAGNSAYIQAMDRVDEVMKMFRPQFLFISAGFDAHLADPLAHIRINEDAYIEMTRRLKAIAETYGEGRLVSVLEGGYNLTALRSSVLSHVRVLMDEERGGG